MKCLALVLLVACAGKSPTHPVPPSPPPPPTIREYRLQSLEYEDVYPGNYAATLKSYVGTPTMGFGGRDGRLVSPSVVSGVLHVVFADSTESDHPIAVLPQGTFPFSFRVDSGIVTFETAPPLWPFPHGAALSDSLYSFTEIHCYNPDCSDYIRLAFRWVRP